MLKKVFKRGLLTVLPIVITIVIVVWLFELVENFFAKIYIALFGPKLYFDGMGIIIAIIVIFIVGLLMSNWIMQKIHEFIIKWLDKMPVVKTLYRSIDDLMTFFKQGSSSINGPIVMVDFHGCKIMGLVSRETFNDLPADIGQEGEIAVYIPMSYQIGGVTVIVPKSMVKKIDMNIEEGLRFAATAGMPSQQVKKDNGGKQDGKNKIK